ncbi:MAG: isoprenylcysteine carboxylmethyltransferase family protein [Mariniblastus sp.]
MFEFLKNDLFRIGYFNWWLVSAYVILVGVFLYGILRPRRKSEWKSAGAAQAWVVALYAEMYGTPLTAYFVMGWLGRSETDAENHFNGHLWPVLFGANESQVEYVQFWFTLVGQLMILVGAILAIVGWRQLHRAAAKKEMAEAGIYHYIRHPQYTGFFLFLIGSMINWPTILTLLTLPILLWVYLRLARTEERDAIAVFGVRYKEYMARTGRFVPKIGKVITSDWGE